MSLAILGIGTAVPMEAIDQATACRLAETLCCRTTEQATWLPTMYGNTGIEKRHMVLAGELIQDVLNQTRQSESVFLPSNPPDNGPTTTERLRAYFELAGPLALEATRQAIERAGVLTRDLAHLVTVTCTGFHAPGVDVELIRGLDLPSTIERTHVGFMGCHGAVLWEWRGLRIGSGHAFVCATERRLHYYYGWDPQKIVANALFADGSAALVGVSRPPRADTGR